MELTPKQKALLEQAAWEEAANQVREQIISKIEDPSIVNTYLRTGIDVVGENQYMVTIFTYRLKLSAIFSLEVGPIKPLINQLEKFKLSEFYSWVYENDVDDWLKFLKSL